MKTFNKKLGLVIAGVLASGVGMADNNTSNVSQAGTGTNTAYTYQIGSNDHANTLQEYGNSAAYTYQSGNYDEANTTQRYGSDAKVETYQSGWNDTASNNQSNNNNAAYTEQSNNWNTTTTVQNGYLTNYSTVKQW